MASEKKYYEQLSQTLTKEQQKTFSLMVKQRRKNPWIVLLLAIFLPMVAADRLMLGERGAAFLKIIYFPLTYGISAIAIKFLELFQTGQAQGFSFGFVEPSIPLLVLVHGIPYLWIAIDILIAFPRTKTINKRVVEEIYFRLLNSGPNTGSANQQQSFAPTQQPQQTATYSPTLPTQPPPTQPPPNWQQPPPTQPPPPADDPSEKFKRPNSKKD